MDSQLDWWPSPAKLNLFLHINGRNDNGYHALQTLFQMLDVGDSLAFETTNDGIIALQTPIDGVPDEDNLIVRAALALQQAAQVRKGARIWLDKQLPMGGGIGGGSSNAATVLVALNTLWDCHLSVQALADIGVSLGADVPIFVHGLTAFAEGVGEIIHPVSLPESIYLVVNPGCHVSTAEIFSQRDLPRNTPRINWQDYEFDRTRNDCQKLVCERHPEVAKLLQWLLEYAPSRMTGTGACLFAIFDCESAAQTALGNLPDGCSGFVARGVNTSPLRIKSNTFNRASDNN